MSAAFVPALDGLSGAWRLAPAVTRSISAENPTGEPGQGGRAVDGTGARYARDLGVGWKVSPSLHLAAGEEVTLADITGSGAIQHVWLTALPASWRALVVRWYWDGADTPAVQAPLGDLFCNGWCEYSHVASVPVAVTPHGGLNAYWTMPFRSAARLTIENLSDREVTLYYQVDYTLTDVPDDAGYFHAAWRRSNPLARREVHVLLDDVEGAGQYVGTYLAWGVNNSGWWGEGEVKFYLDDDDAYPTICGTGTEDYVGGAWCFDVPGQGYVAYTTPYLGLNQVLRPDGLYRSQQRFGMYRWHLPDPIRFRTRIRATVQALGWRGDGDDRRYLPLQDDIASTVFWYADRPAAQARWEPDREQLEVV